MKRILTGGTALVALGLAGAPAVAQEVIEAVLTALEHEVTATGYEVTRVGGDEVVTGLRLVEAYTPDPEVTISIDRMVFSDVDDYMVDPVTFRRSLLPAFSAVTVEGFRAVPNDPANGEMVIDRIRLAGADFSGLLALIADIGDPDPMALSTLEEFHVAGVLMDLPLEGVWLSLREARIADVEDMLVGTLLIESLEFVNDDDWDPVSVSVARIEGAELDLMLLMEMADARPDELTDLMMRSPLSGFAMSGIEIDADGERYAIEEFVVGDVRIEDDITTAVSMRMTGLVIPVESMDDDYLIQILQEGEISALVVDFALSYDIDIAARTLVVDPFRIAVADAGAIEAMIALSGVPVEALGALDTMTEDQAAAVSLDYMRLSYEDLGVIDLSLAAAGREMGMSREALIAQAVGGLQMGLGMLGGVPSLADAPQAVEALVRNSGRLTVELAPAAPVSIMMTVFAGFADPASAIEMLSPSVTHE